MDEKHNKLLGEEVAKLRLALGVAFTTLLEALKQEGLDEILLDCDQIENRLGDIHTALLEAKNENGQGLDGSSVCVRVGFGQDEVILAFNLVALVSQA